MGAAKAAPPSSYGVSPIMRALEELHAKVSAEPLVGAVADYIPELTKADPRWFGIAVATADGQVYSVGDVGQRFTIQSISKPFVYGFVLEALGLEETLSKVGVEPSGEAFNSISLYPDTGRPYNPMINAGAIACTGLFHTLHGERTVERLVQRFSRLADHTLEIDRAVCDSERSTGHRNRAIAHLLRNFDILTGDDVERALDAYFAQCSILVSTRELAIMGATLANHGRNPVSDQVVMAPQHVHHVLSVMGSCGVYDYSGEWGFRVGLPAKSGVGGGILAVLPGQLAIAVFSPPLDARGNSARGIRVCEELARRFQLHMLRTPRLSGAVIRKDLSASELRSRRIRRPERERILEEHGAAIRMLEAQGDLTFGGVEMLTRRLSERFADTRYVVLDLQRVTSIDETAVGLLLSLLDDFERADKTLVLSRCAHLKPLLSAMLARRDSERLSIADDPNAALDECEERLLAEYEARGTELSELNIAEQQLTEGLSDDELDTLERFVERRVFAPGALIVREGEPARELFFVAQGQVSVLLGDPRRPSARVATLSAGLSFGEMAMIEERVPRSASVRAELPTICLAVPYEALDRPELSVVKHKLIVNIARNLADRLRKANAEIRSLT